MRGIWIIPVPRTGPVPILRETDPYPVPVCALQNIPRNLRMREKLEKGGVASYHCFMELLPFLLVYLFVRTAFVSFILLYDFQLCFLPFYFLL